MIPTLLPAYGRDYKSKADILADLNADKDFVFSSIQSALVNRPQLVAEGCKSVVVRYAQQRKVTSFSITREGLFK
jgi:hypothetical protein